MAQSKGEEKGSTAVDWRSALWPHARQWVSRAFLTLRLPLPERLSSYGVATANQLPPPVSSLVRLSFSCLPLPTPTSFRPDNHRHFPLVSSSLILPVLLTHWTFLRDSSFMLVETNPDVQKDTKSAPLPLSTDRTAAYQVTPQRSSWIVYLAIESRFRPMPTKTYKRAMNK